MKFPDIFAKIQVQQSEKIEFKKNSFCQKFPKPENFVLDHVLRYEFWGIGLKFEKFLNFFEGPEIEIQNQKF